MTDDAYHALRDAVNLARMWQIRRLPDLKQALLRHGWSEQTATEAIQAWSNYEKAKRLAEIDR